MGVDARAAYTVRLAERRRRAAALARAERRIGTARLALFVAALVLAWLAFGLHAPAGVDRGAAGGRVRRAGAPPRVA